MLARLFSQISACICCILSEGKPRDAYPRYSNPQRVRDFEQRENNNNEFYHGKREYYTPERNFSQEEQPRKEMRGEEQLQRGRDYSYDRGREVSQYITEKYNEGRNYVENDAGSERNYRKSVGDASVSLLLSTLFFFYCSFYFTFNIKFSLLNFSFRYTKGVCFPLT